MQYHPDSLVRQKVVVSQTPIEAQSELEEQVGANGQSYYTENVKSTKTNLPFYKKNEFDYGNVLTIFGVPSGKFVFPLFLVVVVFIVTAVSIGANITEDRKRTRLNSSH